jgi:hypothetical protein
MGLIAGSLTLTLIGCSPKNAKTVVGKWSVGNRTTVTFTADGKAVDDEKGKIKTGDYFITNSSVLSLKMPDVPARIEFDVIFPSENEMLLTKREPRNSNDTPNSARVEATRLVRLPDR